MASYPTPADVYRVMYEETARMNCFFYLPPPRLTLTPTFVSGVGGRVSFPTHKNRSALLNSSKILRVPPESPQLGATSAQRAQIGCVWDTKPITITF